MDQDLDGEFLDILRDEVESAARLVGGVSGRAARDLAQAVKERVAIRVGGSMLYVPMADRRRRRTAALEEFNGRNHDLICRRYQISRRTLYRWLSYE